MRLDRLCLTLFVCFGLSAGWAAEPGRSPDPAGPAPAPAPATGPGAAPAIAPVDDAWRAGLPRDAQAATDAYMARLPAAAVARADAYAEGGYWLQLGAFVLGLGVAAWLVGGRRSARVRDWAQRVGRGPAGRDLLYGAVYTVAVSVMTLPLAIYQGFWREHAYGLATQTFTAWLGEWAVELGVTTVLSALAVAVLYAVIRRAGERWWAWGAGVSIGMLALLMLIKPIWIDPLFNTYTPIEDGPVKSAVLAMARADGVPAENVYVFDASRQTTRVSANVSGLFGTAAVRLNDNLLRRGSEAEIRAVMGHELGHYVMNHVVKVLLQFGLLLLTGFLFAQWALRHLLRRHGDRLGLRGVGDVASYPVLVAVLSVYFFAATPVLNTIIRTQEVEADRFGLNLAREPHGAAEAYLKLTEYRKPRPGPWEEALFFDHPSTYARIHGAMQWREAMGTP